MTWVIYPHSWKLWWWWGRSRRRHESCFTGKPYFSPANLGVSCKMFQKTHPVSETTHQIPHFYGYRMIYPLKWWFSIVTLVYQRVDHRVDCISNSLAVLLRFLGEKAGWFVGLPRGIPIQAAGGTHNSEPTNQPTIANQLYISTRSLVFWCEKSL